MQHMHTILWLEQPNPPFYSQGIGPVQSTKFESRPGFLGSFALLSNKKGMRTTRNFTQHPKSQRSQQISHLTSFKYVVLWNGIMVRNQYLHFNSLPQKSRKKNTEFIGLRISWRITGESQSQEASFWSDVACLVAWKVWKVWMIPWHAS